MTFREEEGRIQTSCEEGTISHYSHYFSFFFFFPKLVISLPDLKSNASNEQASPIVLPGKPQNDGHKVQLGSNHAKSSCHGKWPSMAQDRVRSSAHCKCGFPGCNKLAKLQLFDICTLNLAPAQPAAMCGVALEITPWMSCSLRTISSLWIANREQSVWLQGEGMVLASQSMLHWGFPPKGTQIALLLVHSVLVLNKYLGDLREGLWKYWRCS